MADLEELADGWDKFAFACLFFRLSAVASVAFAEIRRRLFRCRSYTLVLSRMSMRPMIGIRPKNQRRGFQKRRHLDPVRLIRRSYTFVYFVALAVPYFCRLGLQRPWPFPRIFSCIVV